MNLNDKRASAYGTFSSSKNIPSSQKESSVQKSTSVQKTSPLRKFVSEQNEVKSQNGILSQNHSNVDDVLFKVPAQEQNGKESVYRRVAKFLIILGVEQSAKVLQLLTPEQIEKIVPELASIRSVSPEEKEVILAEFEGLANQTMELGGKQTVFTILEKAYGEQNIKERHRHRYEFNNDYREQMKAAGLTISGTSPDGTLVEAVEVAGQFHVGVQFHPEFKSRPNNAGPLFVEFLKACNV